MTITEPISRLSKRNGLSTAGGGMKQVMTPTPTASVPGLPSGRAIDPALLVGDLSPRGEEVEIGHQYEEDRPAEQRRDRPPARVAL
jgi:hypothetical protein